MIFMLLPLQGDNLATMFTQGVALGLVLLPFQGVLAKEKIKWRGLTRSPVYKKKGLASQRVPF